VSATGVATCAIAVFLGHVFPVFLRFSGGKGVATAGGILFAINVWLGAATLATWIVVALFFRYSSLAAVSAAGFAPLYAFFLFGMSPALPAVILISALLVWRHKTNIFNLVAGRESRIGEKK
jgi:glycerol-3-phosphate acyltransferase PlsY